MKAKFPFARSKYSQAGQQISRYKHAQEVDNNEEKMADRSVFWLCCIFTAMSVSSLAEESENLTTTISVKGNTS